MNLLEQDAIFLVTAVIVVPLSRRVQLGAVLGYLAAGAIIGPGGLGLIADADATLNFAEMGVVLLLFLIGLELEPSRLWALRHPVFGLGGAQVVVTGIALTGIAVWLNLSWQAAIVVGVGLAMSSTAIVLAWLGERGKLSSRSGRLAFAILLFQDVAVIPLIALLPLLSPDRTGHASGWILAAKGVAAIAFVIVASRLLVRPALKLVARFGGREVFTAAALLVVIGAALTMEAIGISMSLGAFLAGVLLADSEFRHELEADVEPFKGLLLGLFFMAVGMSANLGLLKSEPLTLLALTAAFLFIKIIAVTALGKLARARGDSARRLGIALPAGGEFAFVLFTLASRESILDAATSDLLVLAVTLSMMLGTLLLIAHDSIIKRWLVPPQQPYDAIEEHDVPVIIAGFGRFGQIVARVLRVKGLTFTALAASQTHVDFVRRFGNKVYYGDASRLDLLRAAGAASAQILVLAIDDVAASTRTAVLVREQFPRLKIFARARNRQHAFALMDAGVRAVIRDTYFSSLEMATSVLEALGETPAAAREAVRRFRQHDEETLAAQYQGKEDEAKFLATTREAAEQLEKLFEADQIKSE